KTAEGALQYTVDDGEKVSFTPKLTILIDPSDGSPIDAWLSPDTRRILRRLARASKANTENTVQRDSSPHEHSRRRNTANSDSESRQLQFVEVPLTADSEFFQTLRQ